MKREGVVFVMIFLSVVYCSLFVTNKLRERKKGLENKQKNKNKGDDDGQVTEFKSAMDELYPFAKEKRQRLLDDLKFAQKIYDRDPTDAHNLKNWASTLIHLSFMRPREKNHHNIEQWLRDAKSKLEEALKIDDEDYKSKFKLGKVHYHILQLDTTLKRHDDFYMKLCHDARELFKEVQEKAPNVYNDSMLEKIEAFFSIDWPKLRLSVMAEIENEKLGGEQGGEDMNENEKEDMIEQMPESSGEAFPNGGRNYDQENEKYNKMYAKAMLLKKLRGLK